MERFPRLNFVVSTTLKFSQKYFHITLSQLYSQKNFHVTLENREKRENLAQQIFPHLQYKVATIPNYVVIFVSDTFSKYENSRLDP